MSNASGALANTYTYDSFGALTASSGSIVNPYRFTARELDTETGLMYYRARYYDLQSGRFINEDPIRFSGGVNFYTYVFDDPSSLVDPSGLDATITFWPGDAHGYGHIGIGVDTDQTTGFYPTTHKTCLVWGCDVPGRALSDPEDHPGVTFCWV